MDRTPVARNWIVFMLLSALLLLTYSNSFQASWHFDDNSMIVNNPWIKINDLDPTSIYRTFFASLDGGLYLGNRLYRPFTCLTFALNWYVGKENVTGYHVVNLIFHFATAFILYLTVLTLLKVPNTRDRYEGRRYFIALLTAVLWAVNPIQSQAVTYIVQRMAVMATLFYVLGIFFYLKARISNTGSKQILFFCGCFFSFLLAMGSKENAATLPMALLILEILFFQNLKHLKINKTLIWGMVVFGFFSVLLVLFFFYQGKFSSVMSAYHARPFSAIERLMTQPRIIIFYLSLVFYPLPSRLSIEHDIAISTSLFHPWTTLPSIIFIIGLIGFGLSQAGKRPLLSFAILFYFLNHLIESTIFPLELVFEHRNYLPSLYLFLPVSAGIGWLLDLYKHRKRSLYVILGAALTILIIFLGLGTYLRNMAWATEKTLWEDAMQKAPGRARPYKNLAWGYYEIIGDYQKAFHLYRKALGLKSSQPLYSQISSLSDMAGIHYRWGEYEKALALCKKALELYPHYRPALRIMVLSYANMGNWQQAFQSAELLLSKHYLGKDYRILYGFCLLKLKKYDAALGHLRDTLRMYPNDKKILYNIGVTLSRMQYYDRADLFLRWARKLPPNNLLIDLFLVENSLRAGKHSAVQDYLENIFSTYSIKKIAAAAKGVSNEELIVTFSPEVLAPLIARKMEDKIQKLETLN